MSLTYVQIEVLEKKMNIPLVFCDFKDFLLTEKQQINSYYIINMQDEYNAEGRKNPGTHWVSLTIKVYNGKTEYFYFDSFSMPAPIEVENFLGIKNVPYSKKCIQGLLSNVCGYFCLALGHYLFSWEHRTGDLYSDANNFLELFEDMNENYDFYKNEFVLRHFFQSSNPSERVPIKNSSRNNSAFRRRSSKSKNR